MFVKLIQQTFWKNTPQNKQRTATYKYPREVSQRYQTVIISIKKENKETNGINLVVNKATNFE